METAAGRNQPDLRTYLQVLWRRKLTIAVTILIFVAVAVAYSVVAKPMYKASAQVLVPEQQPTSALQPANNSQLPDALSLQRTLSDAQQFAKGNATKQAAETTLGFPAGVSVSASTTSDILTFTASHGNRFTAAKIANAYAEAFISANRANQVAQYTQQVSAVQSSIAKLQTAAAALPPTSQQYAAYQASITSLTQSVQQLQAGAQLAAQTGPSVVNAAAVPSSPSSPRPIRNGLIALALGIVVGVALAFVRDRLDDKVTSIDDVRNATNNAAVVGLIPTVSGWRRSGSPHLAMVEDSSSPASEAYRTLRTAIQFLSIDEPKRVFGFTSSLAEEGKSTTVANLALSFARAGRRVIAVSADLRRPKLHGFFGIDNHLGFTSVLLGETTLRAALQRLEGEPNLRVLPSGPAPPNPAEILSLDRSRELVEALAASADVVLIDCPPVLPVSDALLISRLTDGFCVVTDASKAKQGNLRRTFELLHQVNAPVLGTIVNMVPATGAGRHYGYGYSYEYTYDAEKQHAVKETETIRSSLDGNADIEPAPDYSSDPQR
jgi:capsular exopolysaccharide synthesis family protein